MKAPFVLIVLIATSGWASEPDPTALLRQAHSVAAKRGDYRKAISLLQKANTIWSKNGERPAAYVESLAFLASLYLAEDRRSGAEVGIGRDNGIIYSQWKTQSSELISEALKLSRAASPIQPEELAFALELQSLMTGKNDSGQAWKEATEIRSRRVSEILPAPDTAVKVLAVSVGDASSPTLLRKVEPLYSAEAQTLQTSGVVHLSVVIEPDGTTSSAQLIEGIGFGLDEQAAKAVKQWRFNPGMKDGQNVRVRARVEVAFKQI